MNAALEAYCDLLEEAVSNGIGISPDTVSAINIAMESMDPYFGERPVMASLESFCGTSENLISDTVGVFCHDCREKRIEKWIAEFNGDTDCTNEIVCPWCGYEHSDSWEMGDGETECHDCGRKFETEKDVTVTYSTSRI